jgi:Type I phosphodiesterase / nucleotide pyrophosphatase
MKARALSCLVLAALAVTACTRAAPRSGASPTPGADAEPASAPPAGIEVTGEPRGPVFKSACRLASPLLEKLERGYYPGRSPEIVAVPTAPNFFGSFTATTHSGPWDYVQRVPLVLYGPGFVRPAGDVRVDRPVTLADLAPTLAELIGTPWPKSHPGRALPGILKPANRRAEPPRVVVVVVWDGGGWDVLNTWAHEWPNLDKLMDGGASVQGVRVGSSPSVTPAIHATIGTGAFPKQHGIVDIPLRDGPKVVGSWDAQAPTYLAEPTLADLYDPRTGNRAEVGMIAEKGWHLGMIGHGSAYQGGDQDFAVMGDLPGKLYTNPDFYELPGYLQDVGGFEDDVRTVDVADGRLDKTWQGHEMLEDVEQTRLTPVFSLYQTRLIKELMTREQFGADSIPDLLYTNFKQIDLIGHGWNMLSPEDRDAVHFSDQALGELVDFLNRQVGERKWVIAVTADHGQTPLAESNGAWPIDINAVVSSAAEHFGMKSEDMFQDVRPGALWLDTSALQRAGVSLEEVARHILGLTVQDTVAAGEEVPPDYTARASEPVFSTVFPYSWMPHVLRCADERS